MSTLPIEHASSDLPAWTAAFDRLAPAWERAGARRYRIVRPANGHASVMLDIDVDSGGEAAAFLAVLRRDAWGSEQASPALVGAPQARILDSMESQDGRRRTAHRPVSRRSGGLGERPLPGGERRPVLTIFLCPDGRS